MFNICAIVKIFNNPNQIEDESLRDLIIGIRSQTKIKKKSGLW